MKKFCILLFLVLQLTFPCSSQNFEKHYSYIDFINDFVVLDNGDVVFVGRFKSDFKLGSVIFKITSTGDSVFAKDLPIGQLSHLIRSTDNGYLVGGQSLQLTPILVKFDSFGNTIWTQEYGSSFGAINALVEKPGGGFLLLENGFKLRNIDANGNTIWYKDLSGGKSYGLWDIKLLQDGNYICGGYDYNSYVTYYAKVNLNGDLIWDKHNLSLIAEIFSVNPTTDNGFILTGHFYSNPGFIKCDSLGEVEYAKEILCAKAGNFRYGDQTSDGGFVFSGVFISDQDSVSYGYVVKTDRMGDTLWTRKLSYSPISYEVDLFKGIETKNKKYLICGYNAQFAYLANVEAEITSSTNSDFIFYPNPIVDKAAVKFGDAFPQCDFILYDALGQPCIEMKGIKLHTFEVTREGLSDGIYFYKCTFGEKIISKGQILIIR